MSDLPKLLRLGNRVADEWTRQQLREAADEIERLRAEYLALAAALWACPPDEVDSSHAENVSEAERQVMALAACQAEIVRLRAENATQAAMIKDLRSVLESRGGSMHVAREGCEG